MGFFDGFKKGLSGKNAVSTYNSTRELEEAKYRDVALENTDSNYGWYTCPRCGRKFRKKDMHADHIIPQSRGGSNSRYNLQMLCAHCNTSKRDSTTNTDEDLARRRREINEQDKKDAQFIDSISKKKRGRGK